MRIMEGLVQRDISILNSSARDGNVKRGEDESR